MLHVKNNTEAQELFVPRTANGKRSETYSFLFRSCARNTEFTVEDVRQSDVAVSYYIVTMALEKTVGDGEYQYELKASDGEVVATGLARIGKYERVAEEYHKEKTEFIEYGG